MAKHKNKKGGKGGHGGQGGRRQNAHTHHCPPVQPSGRAGGQAGVQDAGPSQVGLRVQGGGGGPAAADRYVPQYPAAVIQAREDEAQRDRRAARAENDRPEQGDLDAMQRIKANIKARKQNIEYLELEEEYAELGRRERELLAKKAAYEQQQVQRAKSNGRLSRPAAGGTDGAEVAAPEPPKPAACTPSKTAASKPPTNPALRKPSANEPVLMPAVPNRQFSLAELPANTIPKRVPSVPKAMKRAPNFPPPGNEDRDHLQQPRQAASPALNYEGFNDEAIRYGGGKRLRADPITIGGRDDAPAPQADATPRLRVNPSELQRRVEELRAKQDPALQPTFQSNPVPHLNAATQINAAPQGHAAPPGDPTVQTKSANQRHPAPVPDSSQLQLVLPEGVIPGITPNWQNYLELQKKGADV